VYGATGIEGAYDDLLSGGDDRFFVRRLGDLVSGRVPRGGVVELTVDRALQETAAQALGDRRGAVVALDPRTGAVLAMVTSPSYDPNALSSHDPRAIRDAFARLDADPADPLLNRAAQRTYPPGSVFKIVTAAAVIEQLGYRPDTIVDSPPSVPLPLTNRSLSNFGNGSCGGPRIPLAESFRRSCNADFAILGDKLGTERLLRQAERFGFNARPDFSLPVAASRFPEGADRPQTMISAIGQFDVRTTPLQMALVAAAVANRGNAMRPYVVSRVLSPELEVLETTRPRPLHDQPACTPETAALLAAMMEDVVANGTARRAQIAGVRVAGKTGTAQQGEGRPPHAWFVGFAPAEAPRIAVAVVVEGVAGGSEEATGGAVAAPVARAVMARGLASP
jgi:peptidoglycan glycosyltransferase